MHHAHHRSGWFNSFATVGALIVTTWGAVAQQPLMRVDDNALKNASSMPDSWLTYGLDYAETRYSTLKQIDSTNVGRLGLAWVAEIGAGGGGQEATPLVANGVLYAITNWSVVYAIDARTGKELWRFDPKVDRALDQEPTDRICCGVVQRGIALYQGKVYVPAIDGRLIAVDAENGRQIWETQTLPPHLPYSVTMAPRVVKGKVIIGNSGAEYAVRGYVSAYDADTGKLAWRFFTVPGDPSKPFEHPDLAAAAKTWNGQWWTMGGGAPCGMRLLTTRTRTCSTSAPATAGRGIGTIAVRAEATICTSPPSSPSSRIRAAMSGITRRHPAKTGTTRPCSTSCSPIFQSAAALEKSSCRLRRTDSLTCSIGSRANSFPHNPTRT